MAAPNRKSPLAAWCSDVDLFARDGAEFVEDAELAREPLAEPGRVIRRLGGTPEERIAALARS